jgi:phosphinothricin acetyltransferase
MVRPAMLRIRPATPQDAAAVAAIYAPVVERTMISFEEIPPDADEMRSRIERIGAEWPWLVACDGDGVRGYAYGSRHRSRAAYRWSVDTSVYVAEDARGMGVGKALYARLLDDLIARGFYNAFAGIGLPNDASVALHRAFGFEPVGVYRNVGFKFGKWHDVAWWQLQLRPPDGAPQEIIRTSPQ